MTGELRRECVRRAIRDCSLFRVFREATGTDMRFLVFINHDTKFVMLKIFPADSARVFTCEMSKATLRELRDQLDVALSRLENSSGV